MSRRALAGSIAALLATVFATTTASAATYFWDGGTTDIATNGNGVSEGGAGTWNKAIRNWDVGASPHVVWADNNAASFDGAGNLVTLGAPIIATGLSFGSGGYSIAANGANTLSITGSTSSLTTAVGITTLGGPVVFNQGNVNQTWSIASGSTLNLTGSLTQGASAVGTTTNLTFTSPGATGGTVNYSGTNFAPYKFTLAGGVIMNSTGSVNIPAGSGTTGIGDGTSATLNISSGTFTTAAANLFLGNTLTANATDVGTLNITGGTVTTKNLLLGTGSALNGNGNGTGVITLTGGTLSTTSTAGTINLGNAGSGSGTLNLDGGIFQTNSGIAPGTFATTTAGFTKASVLNLNGTQIQALGTSFGITTGITANVRNGGAKIDTGSSNVSIAANLLHSSIGGDNAVDGGLIKTGTAILTLGSSLNTYTGPTLVSAGTLALTGTSTNAVGVLGGTPSIAVATGAILTLSSGGNDVLGTTAGIGALVINGGTVSNNGSAKRVTLANTVTMTGGILGGTSAGDANGVYTWNTLNGGLTATSASNGSAATVNVKTSLQANTVFNITRGTAVSGLSPDTTVSGVVIDYSTATGKSLTKTGNGTLLLNGANTYTGATFINDGILRVGNATALGVTGTAPSMVSGTTVSGTGALDLNAQNLGAEPVTISGAGPDGQGAIINSSTTAAQNALRFLNLAGDATIGGTGRWDLRVVSTATLNMGGFTLTKTGANFVGLVGLTSTVSNPGNIIVNQGTFDIESNTNLGGSATNSLTVNPGGTLQFYSQTLGNVWTLKLNGGTVYNSNATTTPWSGPVQLTGANTINGVASSVTSFTGGITGTGSLEKTNPGVLLLSGTNTYSGPTTVTGGTLRAAGVNTLSKNSGITVVSGAVLDLQNSSNAIGSLAGAGSVTLGAATLTLGGDNTNAIFTSVLSGAGGLVKNGSGTQTLSGNNTYTGTSVVNAGMLVLGGTNTYSGNVTINGGTLQVGDGINKINDGSGTIAPLLNGNDILDNGTLAFNRLPAIVTNGGNSYVQDPVFTTRVFGSGGLAQNGTDTLIVTGANDFTGPVTITNGILAFDNLQATGTTQPLGKGNSVILGGTGTVGTLQINGSRAILDRTITVKSGGGRINNFGNALFTLAGAINTSGNTFTLAPSNAAADIEVTGVISGTGAGTAVVADITDGAGKVYLSAANTYSGPTYIRNGSTILATVANALPTANGRTALSFDQGDGTLDLSADQVVASLNDPAAAGTTISVSLNGQTLTVGTALGTTAFSGTISGTGGLIKDGASTQVLSGLNTFSGLAKVTGGTLQVSGSLQGLSAVQVNAGRLLLSGNAAILDGTVTTTLGNGGILALAGSSHSIQLGALTSSGAVTLDLGVGIGNSLTFNSLATFSGTLNVLNWSGGYIGATDSGSASQDRLLFGNFASLSPSQLANIHFFNENGEDLGAVREIAYQGGYELVPVPEPGAFAALALGAGLLGWRRRPRRAA